MDGGSWAQGMWRTLRVRRRGCFCATRQPHMPIDYGKMPHMGFPGFSDFSGFSGFSRFSVFSAFSLFWRNLGRGANSEMRREVSRTTAVRQSWKCSGPSWLAAFTWTRARRSCNLDCDQIYVYVYICILYMYTKHIYICSPPPPMIHTFGLGKGVLGGGGDSRLQISRKNLEYPGPGLQIFSGNLDFQKKSGVPPDSRLQISVPPGSRLQIFSEKIWSLESRTPDFQKKSGVPGLWTPDSGVCPTPDFRTPRLQTPDFQKKSGVRGSRFFLGVWSPGLQTPDFFWKSGVWSPGLWSPGRGYSRFFLEIWSLESGARVLQIFSGNLESGVRGPGTPDFFWKSGVWIFSGNLESGPGPGTPDFFWKSGVWSPGRGYSRFFLEIWSLESGARVLQIFSGNLESGVRGPGTPDFFLEIWSLESGARVLQIFFWKSSV